MKENEFQCAVCGKTFIKALSEEEALLELQDNFGECSTDNCDLVCNDCYKEMFE